MAWAVVSYGVVQALLLGVAALPAALALQWIAPRLPAATWARVTCLAVGILPTYLAGSLTLMLATAGAMRVLGWRTRPGLVMPIAERGWPLLDWARRGMCTHVVRLLAGSLLRGSPLWAFFLRLNGARMGRGVWINTLAIIDHELLAFGDGTVVGHDVHLSGHTVEGGCVRTGRVTVGRRVTIGVGAVVGIDVTLGDDVQVGALSLVPKHAQLLAPGTYVGCPARRLAPDAAGPATAPPRDSRSAGRGPATSR